MTIPIDLQINTVNLDLEISQSPSLELEINQQTNIELIKTPVNIKGESAYEIAVRNGFIGTENEWLDSLKTSTLNWNSSNW